jgi:hypothetical protein
LTTPPQSDFKPASGNPNDGNCFWCGQQCGDENGGTCLKLKGSTQMLPSDPAYHLLTDGKTSKPTVYDPNCYICVDPEYAQMGLPLCYPCEGCKEHIAADDGPECGKCGFDHYEAYLKKEEKKS